MRSLTRMTIRRINSEGVIVGVMRPALSDLEKDRIRLEMLSEDLNDGSWEWDAASGMTTLSPRLRSMLGYSSMGTFTPMDQLMKFVHVDDHPKMVETIAAILSGATHSFRNQIRFWHADGRIRHILCLGRRMPGDGPPRIMGTHLDISQAVEREEELHRLAESLRQKTEVAEAASNAKSAFMKAVSHELRTPLFAILGFSELIEVENELASVKEYARYLHDAGRRLQSFIESILIYTYFDKEKLLNCDPVDVEEVARAILKGSQIWERRSGVRLLVRGPLKVVRGEGRALRSALDTMLSLAEDFAPEGTTLLLSITQPVGMSSLKIRASARRPSTEATLKPISTSFATTPEDVAAERQGTALKFMLLEKIIDLHGGTLTVRESHTGHFDIEVLLGTVSNLDVSH